MGKTHHTYFDLTLTFPLRNFVIPCKNSNSVGLSSLTIKYIICKPFCCRHWNTAHSLWLCFQKKKKILSPTLGIAIIYSTQILIPFLQQHFWGTYPKKSNDQQKNQKQHRKTQLLNNRYSLCCAIFPLHVISLFLVFIPP